jgi:hypothetical protein
MKSSDSSHRRDFVRALTLTAIAGPVVIADDAKKADDKKPVRSEIDERMDVLMTRFGKHSQLDDKARAAIRSGVTSVVNRAEALRKIPLDNGDGPFPVFHPFRKPIG